MLQYTPRTAKVDDITRMTKKLAAEINLDESKLWILKTIVIKKPIDSAQKGHKYDAAQLLWRETEITD